MAASQADQRNIERGKQAIEAGDWERAASFLARAAEANPRNADVFNLLAYSYRHLGRLDDAFANYGGRSTSIPSTLAPTSTSARPI